MLDPNRFSRVLNNIISNSLKYSSSARKLIVSISLEIYDKSIIIAVSDNGIGITDENLKHIFETFYRADKQEQGFVTAPAWDLRFARKLLNFTTVTSGQQVKRAAAQRL